MAIKAQCPNCGKVISAPDSYLGKKVKCSNCSTKFRMLKPEEKKEAPEIQQKAEQVINQEEKKEVRRETEKPVEPEVKREDKKCPACGNSLRQEAIKCRYCGEIVEVPIGLQKPSNSASEITVKADGSDGKRRRKEELIVVIGVLLTISLVAFAQSGRLGMIIALVEFSFGFLFWVAVIGAVSLIVGKITKKPYKFTSKPVLIASFLIACCTAAYRLDIVKRQKEIDSKFKVTMDKNADDDWLNNLADKPNWGIMLDRSAPGALMIKDSETDGQGLQDLCSCRGTYDTKFVYLGVSSRCINDLAFYGIFLDANGNYKLDKKDYFLEWNRLTGLTIGKSIDGEDKHLDAKTLNIHSRLSPSNEIWFAIPQNLFRMGSFYVGFYIIVYNESQSQLTKVDFAPDEGLAIFQW